jgi:hypothetical protein
MKRLARSVVYRLAVFDFFVFSYFRAFVICSDETPMRHDFAPLSARIIEAAIAVHRALGPGFLEFNFNASTLVEGTRVTEARVGELQRALPKLRIVR